MYEKHIEKNLWNMKTADDNVWNIGKQQEGRTLGNDDKLFYLMKFLELNHLVAQGKKS